MERMNRAVLVFVVLITSLTINTVALLTYPPLADEAIFADIANTYITEGAYQARHFVQEEAAEGRVYGPVFFNIQKLLLAVLGHAPYVYRLANFLAAYLMIAVVVTLFHGYRKHGKTTAWFAVLLLLNMSITRNAVSGRMDMVATLFAVSSLLCACRHKPREWRWLLASAACCSLAYLTTPRALFLLPATFVMLGYSLTDQMNTGRPALQWSLPYLWAMLVFLVPIGLWVSAVGGLQAYVDLFKTPGVDEHLGPTLFRRWQDYLYVPLLLVIMLVYRRNITADRLFVASCASFIAFSLVVKEVGPYRAMIIPYLYLIGVLLLTRIPDSHQRRLAASVIAGVVVMVSGVYFAGRTLDLVVVNKDCRDPQDFERKVLAGIPMDSSFLVGYRFFYLMQGRPAIFSPVEIETPDYFADTVHPDYMLLGGKAAEQAAMPEDPLHPVLTNHYEKVAGYVCPVHDLGAVFTSRRNFNSATLYRHETLADTRSGE